MKTPSWNKLVTLLFEKEGVRRLFASMLAAVMLAAAAAPARAADLYPGNGSAMSGVSADLPLSGPAALISTPTWPTTYVTSTAPFTFNWVGPSTAAVAGLGAGSYFSLEVSAGDPAFGEGNIVIRASTPAIINTAIATIDGAYTSAAVLAQNTYHYWRVRIVDGILLSSGPVSLAYSFQTDYSSPTASGFMVKGSTGGWLGESQWTGLTEGVTVQISALDLVSGLAVSTSALWGGSDGHDWGDLTGGYSVKYSTNAGGNWVGDLGWTTSNDGAAAATVKSLAVYNGKLYAGAGSGYVSVFDGTTWSTANGGNPIIVGANQVYSFAVYKGKLYAGTGAGGGSGGKVAVFDGTTWSSANNGNAIISGASSVLSFTVYNDKLYAGTWSGGGPGGKVVVFDGTNWSDVSGDSTVIAEAAEVQSLAVYNGRLYAGTNTGKAAVFDGTRWITANAGIELISGMPNVWALAVYNGKLYAGTGVSGKVAVFDGTTWNTANEGNSVIVGAILIYSLTVYNGKLYAGTGAVGVAGGKVAIFDGNAWSASNGGNQIITGESQTHSLAVYNGRLYAGSNPSAKVAVMAPINTSLTGADGTNAGQTLSASLDLAQSTNTITCSGNTPCGATNQVSFTVSDMSGDVRTAGPYAVLVDTFAPPAGCGLAVTVAKNIFAAYTSIQTAVNSLSRNLSANTCVVIRDTATYSEQVTVQGFTNNGNRLIIMSDPALVSSSPVVNPPVSSTAAFRIMSDSVTVQGFNIISTNTASYGIYISSAYAQVSSVSLFGGSSVSVAGVWASSFTTISGSTISVAYSPYALILAGSSSTVVQSSITNNGYGTSLYGSSTLNAISLAITGSNNHVSQSTVTGGNGNTPNASANGGKSYGVFISNSSGNTLSTVVVYPGGGGGGNDASGQFGGAGATGGGGGGSGGSGAGGSAYAVYLYNTSSSTVSYI